MLLQRLSPKSRQRRRAQNQYEQLLKNPILRILTIFIDKALKQNATAIAFGFHRDENAARQIADTHSSATPEQIEDMRKTLGKTLGIDQNAPALHPDKAISFLRGPHGCHSLPVWYLRDGTLQGSQSIPFSIPFSAYAAILSDYNSFLVSIDGTPDSPQPRRYIELPPIATQRRLVEVDLEWTIDDLFMIHLRNTITPPPDANISQSNY